MSTSKNMYPPQIKYIVGNEGCERYSFYGMRSILTFFMINFLMMEAGHTTEVVHLFIAGCYLMPLFGSYIADRVWGRYKTILYLSLFYCLGHGVLAIFEGTIWGLYTGLALIAFGSGGIKPCISAFVGDQFRSDQKDLLNKVYDLFYFMINFGSTFSTILTPLTLKYYGPSIAFGIPGILMFIATFIFWLGRKQYVQVPPTGSDPDSFWSILFKGIFSNLKSDQNSTILGFFNNTIFGVLNKNLLGYIRLSCLLFLVGYAYINWGITSAFITIIISIIGVIILNYKNFLNYIDQNHPANRVEEFKIALNICTIFIAISVFWALFDQHASTWVIQAEQMQRMTNINLFGYNIFNGEILASQVSSINPIFVMMLIPIFTFIIYPLLGKFYPMTPLRKIGWGFFVSAFGFIAAALIQYKLDSGQQVHVLWQGVQYLIMTSAEVMISITGLAFAYTQAPKNMKSTIMSFWLLTVFIGNLLTAFIVKISLYPVGSGNFYMFFAVLIFIAGLLFAMLARNYKTRDIMEA